MLMHAASVFRVLQLQYAVSVQSQPQPGNNASSKATLLAGDSGHVCISRFGLSDFHLDDQIWMCILPLQPEIVRHVVHDLVTQQAAVEHRLSLLRLRRGYISERLRHATGTVENHRSKHRLRFSWRKLARIESSTKR